MAYHNIIGASLFIDSKVASGLSIRVIVTILNNFQLKRYIEDFLLYDTARNENVQSCEFTLTQSAMINI